tara:strand:+ start:8027 stop:8359 length:333 start_codon:yes stop_codon:yes gene_type:complete
MPSKTWSTGRPKKHDYEECYTNPNGSVTCVGAQKERQKKAKAKAKAKKIRKEGGKSGRTKKGESTKEKQKQTAKQYKDELGKTIKEMTKEEKRIYNNLAKAESRARKGKN